MAETSGRAGNEARPQRAVDLLTARSVGRLTYRPRAGAAAQIRPLSRLAARGGPPQRPQRDKGRRRGLSRPYAGSPSASRRAASQSSSDTMVAARTQSPCIRKIRSLPSAAKTISAAPSTSSGR